MPTLRSKDAERIDSELEQLEAKFKEARKRKEQLAAKQYEAVGRIMLELVDSGVWTEERLHDLLRPQIKRAKDFELLGITPQADTEPVSEEAEAVESHGVEDMVNDAGHVSEDLTGTTPDAVPRQTL
jgi:hypothetical protein